MGLGDYLGVENGLLGKFIFGNDGEWSSADAARLGSVAGASLIMKKFTGSGNTKTALFAVGALLAIQYAAHTLGEEGQAKYAAAGKDILNDLVEVFGIGPDSEAGKLFAEIIEEGNPDPTPEEIAENTAKITTALTEEQQQVINNKLGETSTTQSLSDADQLENTNTNFKAAVKEFQAKGSQSQHKGTKGVYI